MKPSCSARRFDAVIVPRHDKVKGGQNIFITETALTGIREASLREASIKLSKNFQLSNGPKKIGFLIGGDTDKVKFTREPFEKLVQELKRYSLESGAAMLATSSRRTPAWAIEFLKAALKDKAR